MSAPGASSDPYHPSHVPRATFDLMVPFYEPLVGWLLCDAETRRGLIEESGLSAGHQVLEIGCGTGELTVMLALREPNAHVYGLDPNPDKLARAIGKSWEAGHPFKVYRGLPQRLPFPAACFDRVYASFALSRLTRSQKLAALREVRRVLFREGSLHVVDFAPPVTRWERLLARSVLRSERLRPHLAGELPALIEQAGLLRARETAAVSAPAGRLARYQAFRT
jgi:ubiquinone/menaquinone biosynthesis C-methylase UbiE